jgi:hypothetical protein
MLTFHFIDVGYGDAAVLRLPEGGTILIDGGGPEKPSSPLSGRSEHRTPSLRLDPILMVRPVRKCWRYIEKPARGFTGRMKTGTLQPQATASLSGLRPNTHRDERIQRVWRSSN